MSDDAGKPTEAAKPKKASAKTKRKRLFLNQVVMRRVVYALLPILGAGIVFFGWRVLALLVVCLIGGLGTEWIMTSRRGKPISQACFVTCFLYALSLPPTMPFWQALVGIVVGILFGKEVFGGFGRNFANPAIVGRAFVYVAFPVAMTASFVPAFQGFPGGLAEWSMASRGAAPAWLQPVASRGVDAVTAATPRRSHKEDGYLTPLPPLLFGNIGGVYEPEPMDKAVADAPRRQKVLAAGSIGEVCTVLIVLAGIYLMATRTSNWRLTLSCVLGAAGATVLFRSILGAGGLPPLLFALTAGSLLYVAVFMVTDPVSAPKQKGSIWIYGTLIGALIVVIPWKGQFSGAASFSILLANAVGPSLDMAFRARKRRRAAARETTP